MISRMTSSASFSVSVRRSANLAMASLIVAMGGLHLEEIAEKILSCQGQDRFRMELHAFHAEGGMAHAHDLAFGCFGGYLEAGWEACALDNERMIASRVEGIRQLPENRPSIVLDAGRLAVHKALGSHDVASKCHRQRLVAETHAEYRQASSEMLDHLDGDTSFIGGARSRRDDDAVGLQRLDLLHGNLVIPVGTNISPQLSEVLDEVLGE